MAKVKVLADRISIESEVLTNDVIEKLNTLAPSVLKLYDEFVEGEKTLLFQVVKDEYNRFNNNGAAFKDGKSLGTIPEAILALETEAKKEKVTTLITNVLTKINMIEEQVESIELPDYSEDIDFLD